MSCTCLRTPYTDHGVKINITYYRTFLYICLTFDCQSSYIWILTNSRLYISLKLKQTMPANIFDTRKLDQMQTKSTKRHMFYDFPLENLVSFNIVLMKIEIDESNRRSIDLPCDLVTKHA